MGGYGINPNKKEPMLSTIKARLSKFHFLEPSSEILIKIGISLQVSGCNLKIEVKLENNHRS